MSLCVGAPSRVHPIVQLVQLASAWDWEVGGVRSGAPKHPRTHRYTHTRVLNLCSAVVEVGSASVQLGRNFSIRERFSTNFRGIRPV